jgi:aspartate aminotransferase
MSGLRFSRRLDELRFSPSQALMRRVRDLRRQGRHIIDFGATPDTPQHAKTAAGLYLESEAGARYTDPRGLPELRHAIARKLRRDNGIVADADTEITVSAGGKQGILSTLLALVDAGDEVLLEDPGWLSFEPMVRIAGATPVPIPLRQEAGFMPDIADLTRRITGKTRMLLLCNPHNPTGRVLERRDLEQIARVVLDHDLLVVMDEAYENFVYDGLSHTSLAALNGMRSRTVTIQTASKIYNMFGWRIGWIIAPPEISEKIEMIVSHSITCTTSFAQAGAAAALTGTTGQGDLPVSTIVRNYEAQRNALISGLRAIPGIACETPRGAYFAFPKIKAFGLSSEEMSNRLLEEAGIAAVPGSVFGACGEGFLRFVFNAPVPEIEAGIRKLKDYFRTEMGVRP